MSTQQYSVKVYFIENEATKEIRKFSVGEDVLGSFEYMAAKIRQVFPDLLRRDFQLYWKDDENDYISVSSDDELLQAINGNINETQAFKFFVKVKDSNQSIPVSSDKAEHPGVVCDGCNEPIKGIRFKCMECYDFDLCSLCIQKDIHPKDHEMLRIMKPRVQTNVFTGRMPPFHCKQRNRGPFRCHRRPSPSARNFGNCPFTDNPMNEEAAADSDKCGPNNVGPITGDFASVFGLDPETVKSRMKIFIINPKTVAEEKTAVKESNESSAKEGDRNDGDKTNHEVPTEPKSFEEFIINMSQQIFGGDANVASDSVQNVFDNANKHKKTPQAEDVEKETTREETNNSEPQLATNEMNKSENVKDEKSKKPPSDASKQQQDAAAFQPEMFNQMAAEFAKNLNINPEQINSQFSNLGELITNMFQPQQSDDATDKSKKTTSGDDFIFVDGLTEEERFNKRLEKALKQMESMGFDNDGGWLKQLLISKDLSISKVLDALNPAH